MTMMCLLRGLRLAAAGVPAALGCAIALAQPASVGAAWKIIGNGYEGDLVLSQAADGRLTGTVYGQSVEGYYASGAGAVMFIRYQGGKPYQVFVGQADATGMRGNFYPAGPEGGAGPTRLRFDWSASLAPALIGPSARRSAVAVVPPLPVPTPLPPAAQPPSAAPPSASPAFTGWVRVESPMVQVATSSEGGVTAQCPAGKVVAGGARYGTSRGEGIPMLERAPLADGSGYRFRVFHGSLLLSSLQLKGEAFCIDRPDGYEVVRVGQNLSAQQRAQVEAVCPAGKVAIGGGVSAGGRDIYTAGSAPRADGTGWQGHFRNTLVLPGLEGVSVYAICVSGHLAAARQVHSTPEVQLGPQNETRDLRLACNGGRGLSAGVATDMSAITAGDLIYLEAPNPPANHHAHTFWVPRVANTLAPIEGGSARISLRAICATVR